MFEEGARAVFSQWGHIFVLTNDGKVSTEFVRTEEGAVILFPLTVVPVRREAHRNEIRDDLSKEFLRPSAEPGEHPGP